jgi:hypothetical protein
MQLLFALTASSALLAACGGGGDDAPAPAPAPPVAAPSPAPTPAPAAATQQNATRLAQEAYDAIQAAEQRAAVPPLPGGVLVQSACPGGGSFSYDVPSTFGAGTRYTATFSNCSYGGGYVFNGSYEIVYASFTSATDFGFTVNYDLRYTGPGLNYDYQGTQTCSGSTAGISCTYSDGRRTFASGFTYNGGTVSGSYTFEDGELGTLTYSFSGFTGSGGTVNVTGSNGFTATITRTGVNTFSVVINGSTPFTVTISG